MGKFDVIKRYENNTILTTNDMPAPCCAIYNSGVVKTPDGEYIMASCFEEPNKTQKIWVSRSRDGIHFIPDPEPVKFSYSEEDREEYEEVVLNYPGHFIGSWYDPRINPVDGEYYITYCVGGDFNCRIAIGKTKDFKTIEHVSFPLHNQNRNAVLFPEKINGEYVMLLDLNDPRKVIGRCADPILYVKEPYEMIGQVPNVVFPGALIPEEGGKAKLYYGGADYVQCFAETNINDLIELCKKGKIS